MDYLEPDFIEPYHAWKTNQTPTGNAQMLETLSPVIEKGIRAHVGEPNPLLTSRARGLALQGLRSYDPSRSRLQTHMFNQLQGLKRIARQQSQVIKAPERVIFDQQALRGYEQELADELGREPSDAELANHSGFSLKRIAHVRKYQPGVSEGTMEGLAPGFTGGIRPDSRAQQMWVELVYDDLPPMDQRILELSLGLHGRRPLSNQEIARKLGRSPGAISQRKARIQQLLDKEQELSPFLS